MNKRILCVRLSGTAVFKKIGDDDTFDKDLEELKEIVLLLKEEYGITLRQAEEPDLTKILEEIERKSSKEKVLVLTERPSFPTPSEIFLKNKKKTAFPPPKMGKLNSKPKGRKR